MADNNNSNNESFIWGVIRNWKYKRQQEKMIKNIEGGNDISKNIVRYLPSDIEAFFSNIIFPANIALSGGLSELRSRSVVGSAISGYNQKNSVIVLHAGNKKLETLMNNYFSQVNYKCINSFNSIYDPFYGLNNSEINKLVLDSAIGNNEIKPNGKYYIDGITDFIKSKKISPYIDMYITCPHMELFDKLDQAESKGFLLPNDNQNIKSKLMQGQSERNSIEHYFDTLFHQGGNIFANKSNLAKATSIKNIITKNGVAMIDIVSSTNTLLINLIISEVINSLSSGYKVMLVLDSISVETSEILNKLVKSNYPNCSIIMASDDLYSTLQGNDALFGSYVGSCSKYAVFRHNSAISATKWSQIIGDYDKADISENHMNISNYQSYFSIVPGKTQGQAVNISMKRENRVKPEEILNLGTGEVYIYDERSQELAFCQIK